MRSCCASAIIGPVPATVQGPARRRSDLRAVVERNLRDANLPGFLENNAFGLADKAGLAR